MVEILGTRDQAIDCGCSLLLNLFWAWEFELGCHISFVGLKRRLVKVRILALSIPWNTGMLSPIFPGIHNSLDQHVPAFTYASASLNTALSILFIWRACWLITYSIILHIFVINVHLHLLLEQAFRFHNILLLEDIIILYLEHISNLLLLLSSVWCLLSSNSIAHCIL